MASNTQTSTTLPANMTVSRAEAEVDMKSMTCPNVTTNLFFGFYNGEPARFTEKRQLSSLSQSNLDVRSVLLNEASFRRAHETSRHVPVAGIYQTSPALGSRLFLVEAPYNYTRLDEYLDANPNADCTLLFKQAVEILVHLHARGVVHGSIMADSFAIGPHGKLCLSRFENMRLQDSGVPFNPVYDPSVQAMVFMAPELLQSLRDDEDASLTCAIDVYALGCFGYQLFARAYPFAKYTRSRIPAVGQLKLFAAVVDRLECPTRPVNGNDDVWGAVEACWAPNPANRPTASALLQTLESVLGANRMVTV